MGARVHTGLRTEPLSASDAHEFVADRGAGATAVFTGTVRDQAEGREVTGLTYEAHTELAERRMADIADALARRDGVLAVWLEHRLGALDVGETAVVVGVSSGHRSDAFECCREGIDRVKSEVPIWKQEHWKDGGSHWPGTD